MKQKIDASCYVYLNALVDGYQGLRVTFTDEDGRSWAGIAWQDKQWDANKQLVEKNESDKTTETK